MRKILSIGVIVTISIILGLLVAVGYNVIALRPEPSIQSSQQAEFHEISLTNQLLMKIEKRLEYIQENLAELNGS